MAAAKKREWRSDRRAVAARPVQMTRHLIVCEGTKTEPLYFKGMAAALGIVNGKKVTIDVRGTGKDTLDLFEYAKERCCYALETFDHVWLVFDRDDFPADKFDLVEQKCARESDPCTFHALWSNPCFELWLLLHLCYTTAPMDTTKCLNELKVALKREYGIDYSKNMKGLYAIVDPKQDVAIKNAEKLSRHHKGIDNNKPSEMNPATRVTDIFKELSPYLKSEKD